MPPTVGVDFLFMDITRTRNPYSVRFWDTAGQERFQALMPSYIRNTHLAIIVFDVSRRETFENIDFWIQRIQEASEENKEPIIFLVGNKTDLEVENKVTEEELNQLVEEKGLAKGFLSSCVTKEGIEEIFKSIEELVPDEDAEFKNFIGKFNEDESTGNVDFTVSVSDELEKTSCLPC